MRCRVAVLSLLIAGCWERPQPDSPTVPTRPSSPPSAVRAGVLLAKAGLARVVIVAPTRLFPGPAASSRRPAQPPTPGQLKQRQDERRLADSVTDLAVYLERISGAPVRVVTDSQQVGDAIPVLVGELASARFGGAGTPSLGGQTFRVVVTLSAIGLFGESDLGSSYAVYELLDRVGCRWFLPGELGESIPQRSELVLVEADESFTPSTLYRDIWYADAAFKRRNRLGGLKLEAGHRLEKWLTPQQRNEHPEWRALVKGEPHAERLSWSAPGVTEAIAAAVARHVDKTAALSVSLSPGDGLDFDEGRDRAWDAGDWDSATNSVSLTDRLLHLANDVAGRVRPRHPEVLFGLLAYASYTRPPVREKVSPQVVPVLAPIAYCRQHPWSNDACPGAREARRAFEGWSEHSEHLAFRSYAFNLAEPAAPNPMLRKWSYDLPFVFRHKARFFQPETLPNFETTLPGLYLGIRLAWNQRQDPDVVLRDLFAQFYGRASAQARAYIDFIDRAWTDSNEFSGGALGYARRFTPARMLEARRLLNEAKQACASGAERQRIELLDASLQQLELYLRIAEDLRAGRLATIEADFERWLARASTLASQYAENSAFGGVRWAGAAGAYGYYAKRFLGPIYGEASRIQREQQLLSPTPLTRARYRADPATQLPVSTAPAFPVQTDATMDVASETWSSVGLYDYFGTVWYAFDWQADDLPAGKRAYVWLSKVDGVTQLWLNGVEARPRAGARAEEHLGPLTFDVSSGLRPGAENHLVVAVQRTLLTELGAGGLLGPVYAYRDR